MSKVKHAGESGLRFKCPGCGKSHIVNVGTGRPHWDFNGDMDRPTLSPSIRVRTGHYCNNPPLPGNCACDFHVRFPEEEPWNWPCSVCHSFIRNGQIQFLSDCTHALAGQTVELPEIDA